MSLTATEPRSRSGLMRVMRASPVLILLAGMVGMGLMVAGYGGPHGSQAGERQILWELGYHLLVLDGLIFVAVLWGGVYLEVVEASRGMPGLRLVGEPEMKPEVTARLRALERSLTAHGFRHDGWFSLDDFAETHVSAWQNDGHPAAAFILYFPAGGVFRLRFIRWFPSGGVLVSSTKVTDLGCAPPEGIYIQVRKGASVDELWAWHLEAESLFPDASSPPRGEVAALGPRERYVALLTRWAEHKRRDRTWLLALEPVGECWRTYHLCGMPLARQFELGWATPYWR
jgi:hypothetical protein